MKKSVNKIIFGTMLSLLVLMTFAMAQETKQRSVGEEVKRNNVEKKGRHRQVINPPGISPLVPAYSVAIRQGDLVFVSGMTGFKPGTQDIVEGGVAVQTRQAFENIRTTLQTAGAAMSDIGECTVFLINMADFGAMNEAYIEYFPVNPPARATLAVSALPRPAARVEIKCSAVIQHR